MSASQGGTPITRDDASTPHVMAGVEGASAAASVRPVVRGLWPILKKEIDAILFAILINIIQTGVTMTYFTKETSGTQKNLIQVACALGFLAQTLMLTVFFSNVNMNVGGYDFDPAGWDGMKSRIQCYIAPFGVVYNQVSFGVSAVLGLRLLGAGNRDAALLSTFIAIWGTLLTWAINIKKLERPDAASGRNYNVLRGVGALTSTLCQAFPVTFFYTIGFLGAPLLLGLMDRPIRRGESTLEDALFYFIAIETTLAGVNFLVSFSDTSVALFKFQLSPNVDRVKVNIKKYLGPLMLTNILVLGSLGHFRWMKAVLPAEAAMASAPLLTVLSAAKIARNLFVSRETVRASASPQSALAVMAEGAPMRGEPEQRATETKETELAAV